MSIASAQNLVSVYVAYAGLSVGLTIWLARTLSTSGKVFLDDVFAENPRLAPAVNRLLVVGFYLLNLGYAFMSLKAWLDDIEARAMEAHAPPRSPRGLTVLYDPGCGLCRRCVRWLVQQPSYVPLSFVSCTGAEARQRYGDIPWLGDELVVVSDQGEVWVGPAAFLTCLWALEEYREWSYRLATPAFAPLAERFFLHVSKQRRALSSLFEPACADGTCSIR